MNGIRGRDETIKGGGKEGTKKKKKKKSSMAEDKNQFHTPPFRHFDVQCRPITAPITVIDVPFLLFQMKIRDKLYPYDACGG